MESYSRSTSPPDQPPVHFAKIASDAQRNRIYRDRSSFFRGGLTNEQYYRKTRLLDTYPVAFKAKSVWVLSPARATQPGDDSDYLASLEVFIYDLYWRATPESQTTIRQAAYLAALCTPLQHRGHGYARQLIHHVIASLRVRHHPAPLALVYAACDPSSEHICACLFQFC